MKKASLAVILFIALMCISPAAWSGPTVSTQPTDMFLLAFGKGKVEVKLYSDYFCGACKNLEPSIEYLIADLVERNIVTITFVDTPMHKHSALYAGTSFISSMQKRRSPTRSRRELPFSRRRNRKSSTVINWSSSSLQEVSG